MAYHFPVTVTIDKAGRVVLPKSVRDRFHLVPGTKLDLTSDADGVKLAVQAATPALIDKNGVLVHHGESVSQLDIAEFINQSRASRSIKLAGD